MIVDDEPDVLYSLKIVLEQKNYEVITVDNGNTCIKEIEKGFRGLILMDIMMPDMDGWDTIREIIKRGYMKDIAITIITGKGTKDKSKMIGLESYISDYIAKPFNLEKLLSSVEKATYSI